MNPTSGRRFCSRLICAAFVVAPLAPGLADDPPLPPGLGPAQRKPAAQSNAPASPPGLGGDGRANEEPTLPPGLGGGEAQSANEPALPSGLGGQSRGDDPALPGGLDSPQATDEPALPPGMEGDQASSLFEEEARSPLREWLDENNISGFWEIRGGVRMQRDRRQHQASLGETRLQLEWERQFFDAVTFKITGDLVYDQVLDRHWVNLERGDGFFDLREAYAAFTPLDFMDVKIGRQILTWGTGDLVFLNDLFPKDWRAFLAGRDVEYLKAPSDAIKLSFYSEFANWDVVFTPRFDPDRFITGERISYYNPLLRRRAGNEFFQPANVPNAWLEDHEWATRVYKNVKGVELAVYGYWGYWKSPGGFSLVEFGSTFPRLNVYGGSVRAPLGGGVANFEAAYYDSLEDRAGDDPFVNNSEIRLLLGYERQMPEWSPDLTIGGQYYVEWMMDHSAYLRTLPPLFFAEDRVRHVVSLRVIKLLMNQNLELSLFAFYSPSDEDAYLRPRASYKIDDNWRAEIGGNIFFGVDKHTFFNQFARDTNVYVGLRYSF